MIEKTNPQPNEEYSDLYDSNLSSRYKIDGIFAVATWTAIAISILVLVILLIDVCFDGVPKLNWNFLTSFPSRRASEAGLLSALVGTVWMMVIVAVVSFPIGVGAGIYLEAGVLTGTILALSRGIGETAPLITIGALTFISFLPENLQSAFTVLPIQIFNWVSRPQIEFHDIAAAGIIVLMVVLLIMNGSAIFLRNKFQKKL
jgi:ABC-type phosphate transport system permease subunit